MTEVAMQIAIMDEIRILKLMGLLLGTGARRVWMNLRKLDLERSWRLSMFSY